MTKHAVQPQVVDYRQIASSLRTGDIYLASGTRWVSRTIRFLQGAGRGFRTGQWLAEWSHVGMIVIPSEIGLKVDKPDEPHLWESTTDTNLTDAIDKDQQEGPMLVPLEQRIREAMAHEHYATFAIRRLYCREQPFVATIDHESAENFRKWMDAMSKHDFEIVKLLTNWIASARWKSHFKRAVEEAKKDAAARVAIAVPEARWPMRQGIGASLLFLAVGGSAFLVFFGILQIVPMWLAALMLASQVEPIRKQLAANIKASIPARAARSVANARVKLDELTSIPCSPLLTRTYATLGVIDLDELGIPVYTPDDFAQGRVPLTAQHRLGPIERFTYRGQPSAETEIAPLKSMSGSGAR